MTPCTGTPADALLLESDDETDLRTILENHYDDFFAFAQETGLHVTHEGITQRQSNRSRTVITLPPRCFTVDFNEDFVKISALK